VHSKETDDTDDQSWQNNRALLGVTCHHGEHSHISQTTLSYVFVDAHPVLRYKKDIQTHEEFACNFDPIAVIDDAEDERLATLAIQSYIDSPLYCFS